MIFFGLSEADVQKIVDSIKEITDRMTENGQRIDGKPYLNNFCRRNPLLCGSLSNDLKDCGEQTEYVNEGLGTGSYDDNWNFIVNSGTGHAWGVAISSNSNDPHIFYDPRSGETNVGSACSTCKAWSLPFSSTVYDNDNIPEYLRPPAPRN